MLRPFDVMKITWCMSLRKAAFVEKDPFCAQSKIRHNSSLRSFCSFKKKRSRIRLAWLGWTPKKMPGNILKGSQISLPSSSVRFKLNQSRQKEREIRTVVAVLRSQSSFFRLINATPRAPFPRFSSLPLSLPFFSH